MLTVGNRWVKSRVGGFALIGSNPVAVGVVEGSGSEREIRKAVVWLCGGEGVSFTFGNWVDIHLHD